METHIKNLFQHGVNHYDRVNRKIGSNTLGMQAFKQVYSRKSRSFFGIELSDKFHKIIVDLGRPEIITYSRIDENEKGEPIQIKRANTALVGFSHTEQGMILLFPNGDEAKDAIQRLTEEYPSLTNGDEPAIMEGEALREMLSEEVINELLSMENLTNTDELGRRIPPILEEMVFINAPPALPGKGLYWPKEREVKKTESQVVKEPTGVENDEDAPF